MKLNYQLNKHIVINLIVFYGLVGIAVNLAHPITPSLLNSLKMPSYVFGVAFAMMQFSSFIFSLFWGKLCSFVQTKYILVLGTMGYGIAQGLFGMSKTMISILLARSLAGISISAVTIGVMYLLIRITTLDNRKKYLPLLITSFTVSGAFGQFIGGYLGEISIYLPFYIQVIFLAILAVYIILMLKNLELDLEPFKIDRLLKESNPLKSFIDIRSLMNIKYLILFISVFAASYSSTTISQNFGYYLISFLGFNTSVNGTVRGIVGIASIIINSTLTIKIVRSSNTEKNGALIVLSTLVSSIMMVLFSNNNNYFLMLGIIVMSIDTMIIPIQQDLTTSITSESNQGVVLGVHNSIKSLGAITGALVSGVVYQYNPIFPFILASCFYLVTVIALLLTKQRFSN